MAHFSIKNSAMVTEVNIKKILFFGLGGLSFGISLIFYTVALEKINLSVAFPLSLGIGTVLTTVLAVVFLKETLSFPFVIGLTLIVGGAFLITKL